MVTLVQFLVIFLTGTCQSMLNKSSLCFSCQMTWKERFQTNISVGATRVSSSAWRRHLQRDNLLQSTALDRGMVGGAEKEWKLRWLAREEDCSLLYEERRGEEGDGVMEWCSWQRWWKKSSCGATTVHWSIISLDEIPRLLQISIQAFIPSEFLLVFFLCLYTFLQFLWTFDQFTRLVLFIAWVRLLIFIFIRVHRREF